MAAQTCVGETSSSSASVVSWLPRLLRFQALGSAWPRCQLSRVSAQLILRQTFCCCAQHTPKPPGAEVSVPGVCGAQCFTYTTLCLFKHEGKLLYLYTALYSVDVWHFRAAHPFFFFPANQCKLMGWVSLSIKIEMELPNCVSKRMRTVISRSEYSSKDQDKYMFLNAFTPREGQFALTRRFQTSVLQVKLLEEWCLDSYIIPFGIICSFSAM